MCSEDMLTLESHIPNLIASDLGILGGVKSIGHCQRDIIQMQVRVLSGGFPYLLLTFVLSLSVFPFTLAPMA
jgi:hypothetical protein